MCQGVCFTPRAFQNAKAALSKGRAAKWSLKIRNSVQRDSRKTAAGQMLVPGTPPSSKPPTPVQNSSQPPVAGCQLSVRGHHAENMVYATKQTTDPTRQYRYT